MMYAEHIIGLRAGERHGGAEIPAVVAARFGAILASGALRPNGGVKQAGTDGSLFELDALAGDGQFVFLSYGPRYRHLHPPELCYGFLFDARQLIEECGALVGPDMLDTYDDILDRIIQEVDASLPPLPMASDEEMAEFAALFGEDDPALLAYVQQASTSRYHDIDSAVRRGDMTVEGAATAVARFQAAAGQARRAARKSGAEALDILRPEMEILVPGQLALSLCVGTVEAGEVRRR